MTNIAIVCPTSSGGHIEHAMNLALVSRELTGAQVTIITRAGAREYFRKHRLEIDGVVVEYLTLGSLDRALTTTAFGRSVRFLIENILMTAWLIRNRTRVDTLIVEEPRFILMRRAARPFPKVLVLHNLVEHDLGDGAVAARVRQRVKSRSLRAYSRVLIHDYAQVDALQREIGKTAKVVAAKLPGAGPVECSLDGPDRPDFAQPYALCIGALRRNKNLEFPISACARASVPLLVAGLVDSDQHLEELRQLAEHAGCVSIESDFLSPERFETLIAGAQAVVIAYTDFSASSGVIARAAALGRPLVMVDDPILARQTAGVSRVCVFSRDDERSFLDAMDDAFSYSLPPIGVAELDADWEAYARMALGIAVDQT